jgi:hypothetical protein
MKKSIDGPLLIIALLLAITLFLYFNGVFPYPFGFIILCVFFIARLMSLKGRNNSE